MALLHIDGFDKYGPVGFTNSTALAALLTAGEWTSTSGAGSLNIVAGLSSTGQALSILANSSTMTVSKTLTTNYSRLIGGVRFNSTLVNPAAIQFMDSASNQFSVVINTTTGTISAVRGAYTGTVMTTSAASVTAGVTHYLEWDITFHNSTGAYEFWLDGVSILSASGVDTCATANNQASAVNLIAGRVVGASLVFNVDDFYLLDTSGSSNNAVLNTNPRIETQFPTGDDTTIQFTLGAAVFGHSGAYQGVTATNAPGANQVALRKYTAGVSGTLDSVKILPGATSGTAKFKAVMYADTASAPTGAALDTGTEVVGCTSGTTLNLPLTTPQSITAGTVYWIGFITDTSVVLSQSDANTLGYKAANTYASGAPSGPTMTGSQASWVIYGAVSAVSGANYYQSSHNPSIGDGSYVYDATVGHIDLYEYPTLSVTPDVIHSSVVKANIRRGAGATPTVDLLTKSSATTGTGSNTGIVAGASYAWVSSDFPLDPNSGLAWVTSDLNAATSGIEIAS